MSKFKKSFGYGEKGFTLIELLIVIAILGVLAAVVVPNVGRFMESGQLAAAKQEFGTLQTAIDAAMAEEGWNNITATGSSPWVGNNQGTPIWTITEDGGTDTASVGVFLRREVLGIFRADTTGLIVEAYYPNSSVAAREWHYTGGDWVKMP